MLLQRSVPYKYMAIEDPTALTSTSSIFWDVTSCTLKKFIDTSDKPTASAFRVKFCWLFPVDSFHSSPLKTKQTNSVAPSPRANYTDWATATCRLNLVSTFVDRGVSRGQRGGSPTVVNLSFLLFFQVAPHLPQLATRPRKWRRVFLRSTGKILLEYMALQHRK
jgi:hypothetical protein